jgi:DNA-binding Lrp family transcriptional regulator
MNARQSNSAIAKKVRISPQVADYRIKNLEKKGVILGYKAMIDMAKLGYETYRLYIRYENVTPEIEREIFAYFQKHENIIWFISTSGRFDLEVLFLARNFIHFNKIVREVMKKYGMYLRNHTISVSISNFHHKRYWLLDKKPEGFQISYGDEPTHEDIDETDIKIINILTLNGRASIVEIGEKLKLTPNAIKYRIKDLEKRGIIKSYRTWINTAKLGYKYYKALVTFKYLDENIEKRILEFSRNEKNMLYLVTCIGLWNIEVEVEVQNDEEFRLVMVRFKNLFSDLILDYETLLVYAEHKLDYFPIKGYSLI